MNVTAADAERLGMPKLAAYRRRHETPAATPAPQRHDIAQMGELGDLMRGHITGAQLVVETPDGHRYSIEAGGFEPTIEHPEGRLVLYVSDCEHYSSVHDEGAMRDPIVWRNGVRVSP